MTRTRMWSAPTAVGRCGDSMPGETRIMETEKCTSSVVEAWTRGGFVGLDPEIEAGVVRIGGVVKDVTGGVTVMEADGGPFPVGTGAEGGLPGLVVLGGGR